MTAARRPAAASKSTPDREIIIDTKRLSYGWNVAIRPAAVEHRERRAAALDAQARVRERQARSQNLPEARVREASRWHRSRAAGQRERPERLAACGRDAVVHVSCTACGCVHDRPASCGHALLCTSCRGRAKVRIRDRFMRARASVMGEAMQAGLLRKNRLGGRWSEKFLTLTAPHVAGQTIAERCDLLRRAWTQFSRGFRRWLDVRELAEWGPLHAGKKRPARRVGAYFRRMEWAPGRDDAGHPHFHLWIFCAYLDREVIGAIWRRALRRAGLTREQLDHLLVPDVREVRDAAGPGGGSLAAELIKYVTKDITDDGAPVALDTFAEVFAALDGVRLSQASRGLMARADEPRVCRDCGERAPGLAVIERRPHSWHGTGSHSARGPPGEADPGGEIPY